MALERLKNKNVLLVGFAKTNKSFYKVLRKRYPKLSITISDHNQDLEIPQHPHTKAKLGEGYLDSLQEYQVIVRSPGVPVNNELRDFSNIITTATQLFFEEVRDMSSAKIIAITGTKGKSTTSTLIYEILKHAGKETFLLGNINVQDWDYVDQITDNSIIVYELSSYMLHDFKGRPDISIWLNLYDDHLTWHGGVEQYIEAKSRIASQQNPSDICIYNHSDKTISDYLQNMKVKKIPFNIESGLHIKNGFIYDGKNLILPLSDLKLRGSHNHENILAVLLVSRELNTPKANVIEVLKNFSGLPHRLETIANIDGVEYVDDLLATNPDATIAAIDSFERVACLILGGKDRGYHYDKLGQHIIKKGISHVVLLPGCRNKIKQALNGYQGTAHEVSNVHQAVETCSKSVFKPSVVLLSPAAPSHDQFANYLEKAQAYKLAIEEIES